MRNKEVIDLERRTKVLIISAVLALATISGIGVMVYANTGAGGTNTLLAAVNGVALNDNVSSCFGLGFGGHHGGPRGDARNEFITVSQEYKDNVINVTESDTDVQSLLAEGYNVTEVRPLISTTVETDGTVVMKAANAIVVLTQSNTGRAVVWVDIEQAKVTRIEILTMTVIDKSG